MLSHVEAGKLEASSLRSKVLSMKAFQTFHGSCAWVVDVSKVSSLRTDEPKSGLRLGTLASLLQGAAGDRANATVQQTLRHKGPQNPS